MNIRLHEIEGLVCLCLRQLRADLGLPPLETLSRETSLYGGPSDLDSLAVVHLIVDLEDRLKKQYGLNWILADERALSRSHSPFRTMGTLSDFIMEITPKE